MDCSFAHHIGMPIFCKRTTDIGIPHDAHMATDFGNRLKQARKLAGLTQVQLAKAVGVAQSTIAELERQGYGSAFTPQIAKELKVSATWLASGDGPDPGVQSQVVYRRVEEPTRVDTWPFPGVDRESVARLSRDQISALENLMLTMGALPARSKTALAA